MNFDLGPASDRLRAEVREFLDDAMTSELEERMYRTGVAHDDEFSAALGQRGWIGADWPKEVGGQGLDAREFIALSEELQRADAPVYSTATAEMIGKTLWRMGSDELKADILPKILDGQTVIALGYTEPESGSDVAA